MKKAVLFLAILFAASGCEVSENEGNADASDPIIGSWKLTSVTNNNIQVSLQSCERSTYYNFSAGGAQISGEKFIYHLNIHDCTSEPIVGRWGNDNGHYYIISNYNTQSTRWSDVKITETSMVATSVHNSVTTVLVWKKF